MSKITIWINKNKPLTGLIISILAAIVGSSAYYLQINIQESSQNNTAQYSIAPNFLNNGPGSKNNQIINNYIYANPNTGNKEQSSDRAEIMSTYENNGPYYLKIINCGLIYNSTNKNSVQLQLSPLMYNVKGYPTSIPFYVSIYFEFDGIKDSNTRALYFDESNNPAPLIDPKPRIKQWSIDLTQALENASHDGITKVNVTTWGFTFAPFDTTDQSFIAEYPPQNMAKMTVTELDYEKTNNNWNLSGDNTICNKHPSMKLT